MKCQFCNAEIPDDSQFCSECGKEQETHEPEEVQAADFCSNCLAPLKEGESFCGKCGTPVHAAPVQKADNTYPGNTLKRKGKGHVVILVFLLIALFIVGVAVLAFKLLFYDKYIRPVNQAAEQTEEIFEKSQEAPGALSEIDLADVDYNLLEDDNIEIGGNIRIASDGRQALFWGEELTFYGMNASGEKIFLRDATSAYLDDSLIPAGLLSGLDTNTEISVEAKLYFADDRLYIAPYEVYDEYGFDLIDEANERANQNTDYILPESSTRLLTDSDVSHLSLREINYAKNEIYARHGRLFDSAELQDYFNSKSWYSGTVSPENFRESMLSETEKKNVEFLREKEFRMAPNGYQLDTN